MDGAPPEAEVSVSGDALTVTVRDDQFTAYAAVLDGNGELLAEDAFFPEEAGTACTLNVDLPGGARPDTIYIQAEDYAANSMGYEVDLKALSAGEDTALRRCAAALLKDVDYGAWYHEAVDYVVEAGVMQGDAHAFFLPEEPATRWGIVDALYRANGSPKSGLTLEELPFHDVSSRSKFIDALCWAYEQGVVSGRAAEAFFGTAVVTRQELAVMLYRCAKASGGNGGDLTVFSDGNSVAGWAREAVSWAVGEGLLKGGADGRLDPGDGVTRAETAQILMRFLEE